MPGPARAVDEGIDHRPVLVGEKRTVRRMIGREQPQHRRRHVDQSAADVGHPEPRHPGAGDDEGRPRLDDAQRPMLPEVPALVGPVVRRTMDHAEVGRRRMVEELGELLERVGVAVLVATRVRRCLAPPPVRRSASGPARRAGSDP